MRTPALRAGAAGVVLRVVARRRVFFVIWRLSHRAGSGVTPSTGLHEARQGLSPPAPPETCVS